MDIQIHASCRCNLNCRGCNAFAPIIEEDFRDIEIIKKDLGRLSEITAGIIGQITISGGEPLLNPQLPEILDCARKFFPLRNLKIITNAILLERASDVFWLSCQNNKVAISITRYPIKINIENIKRIAAKYNVNLVYQDDTDIREKTMAKAPLDASGSQNIKKSFRYCYMSNYNFTLENGRLYTCPTIAHIEYLNKFFNQRFIVSERDYIDIYKTENMTEVMYFMRKPMEFCRYCNTKKRVSGIKWKRSKKELSEWL
jgi:MoaA/NifB/PqqE/SkfB family radical SAM enzyme